MKFSKNCCSGIRTIQFAHLFHSKIPSPSHRLYEPVVKGVGALYIHNDKGVVIELKTRADGVALSVGVSGTGIEME